MNKQAAIRSEKREKRARTERILKNSIITLFWSKKRKKQKKSEKYKYYLYIFDLTFVFVIDKHSKCRCDF